MNDGGGLQKFRVKKTKQSNGAAGSSSYRGNSPSLVEKIMEKEEREKLVLWRHPFTTVQYFALESFTLGCQYL